MPRCSILFVHTDPWQYSLYKMIHIPQDVVTLFLFKKKLRYESAEQMLSKYPYDRTATRQNRPVPGIIKE